MLRVLVTRPRFDAVRTAEKLSALGCQTLIDPVIEIEPLPFEHGSENISAIAFTSANATRVASVFETLKSVPVFAVGARTAEVAREAGFLNVGAAAGDVNALGGLLSAELPAGSRVLHLAGEDRAGDLARRLAQHGITLETRVIYRANVSSKLRPETVDAFSAGRIGAVLHYSERSAAAFVRLADAAGIADDIRKTRHLCLSAQVAGPLKLFGVHAGIAAVPEEEALLDLLGP
jgi:uroporphyrinogen-III synthase